MLRIEDRIVEPVPYHWIFHLELPLEDSILQHQLDDLVKYIIDNHMILNSKKTKGLPFNNYFTEDFIHKFSVKKETFLDVSVSSW